MNIGILTNIRSPYKSLQFEEFSKIDGINIKVYYTEASNKKIKWEEKRTSIIEINLKESKALKKLNLIFNYNLNQILKNNDLIIMSGYDQLSMIYTSFLCKIKKKPYIVLFDGISTNKLNSKENLFKKCIKKFVINNSYSIMANGKVGKKYISEKFNYPKEKIFNQYLSVDNEKLKEIYNNKEYYRRIYRKKYNIENNKKVLLFSGRLISKKNVAAIIKALNKISNKNIVLFITGGGELEKEIKNLANNLNINFKITGFLANQEQLFKNYCIADALILPSKDEPWGLVVNEAMGLGLPIIVSNVCGCSLDLVRDGLNGYIVNPDNHLDIAKKIERLLFYDNLDNMGKKSLDIIEKWNFENSKMNLQKVINNYKRGI